VTDGERIEQLEADVQALARLAMKSAGMTPALQHILTRGDRETRPQITDHESRAA
jgi:hypothetical protein